MNNILSIVVILLCVPFLLLTGTILYSQINHKNIDFNSKYLTLKITYRK